MSPDNLIAKHGGFHQFKNIERVARKLLMRDAEESLSSVFNPMSVAHAYEGGGKERLLRLVRRGILLLLRLMVADRTSNRCSYQTMVAGEMSGDAANRCPFEAALGISRDACERQSHRQHCAAESRFHFNTSLRPLLDNPRRQFSFR